MPGYQVQRWRRRWFVLRHSGELPGQYFLEYYTDRNCRKLKGKIDLDQCQQVDAGLQFVHRKQKYQHMFDVKTPKRTYFLAAESQDEMNKWVEYVCHVCQLIACKEDEIDSEYGPEEDGAQVNETLTLSSRVDSTIEETESPPVSPSSTISGPYIAISECISGRPLSSPNGLEDLNNLLRQGGYGQLTAQIQYAATRKSNQNRVQNIEGPSVSLQRMTPLMTAKMPGVRPVEELRSDEFYDSPRQLHLPGASHRALGTPPTSPTTTDGESVFTDEEWVGPALTIPSVNWETFPNADGENGRRMSTNGDHGTWSVVERFGKLTVIDTKNFLPANDITRRIQTLPHKPAPPRPPKPFHLLIDAPSHSYLNLENVAARPNKTKHLVKAVDPPARKTSSDSPPVSPPHTEVILGTVTDETYDFPRSHQQPNSETESVIKGNNRHCYTNAAPTQVDGDVFRYDFHDDLPLVIDQELTSDVLEEPTSPRSEGSSSLASSTTAAVYSNLPSPLVVGEGSSQGVSTPPAVNRGLKPGRKLSDSTSAVSGSELSPGPTTPGHLPPSINRKLKPHRKYLDSQTEQAGALQLAPPPDGSRSLRKNRAAPSPTPPSANHLGSRNGQRNSSSDDDHRTSPIDKDNNFYSDNINANQYMPGMQGKRLAEIQYLDLDLESNATGSMTLATTQIPKSPERSTPTATVYKHVDFLKTQAFNKTRQKVEEERKQCTPDFS